MRAAIAMFGREVSPRFCCAREALIVDVEDGRETSRSTIALGETCNPDRLRLLQAMGVHILVCGGFNRRFMPEAERAGIHVFWGVNGSVDDAVRSLAAGQFEPPHHNPGCWCHEQQTKPVGHRLRARQRRAS